MKLNDTIEMNRKNRIDFRRMKRLLACASKEPTRRISNKVQVKKTESGRTITANDGRRMRTDRFDLEAAPGIYDIKVNSGTSVFLMKNRERLRFPDTGRVIPSLDPQDAYALKGPGKCFVVWAAAAQGCLLDPERIALAEDEAVTLYVQKLRPDLSPAVMKNDETLFLLMPCRGTEAWYQELEAIRTAKAA